ncbi:MAG: NADH-quinone oxidoreductase subunit NuoN [Alphaproteobacteria bacterium]|nr:NADH-quinone oxidoreductase subunit NuoN [Alphaproteobacteria bacterium]
MPAEIGFLSMAAPEIFMACAAMLLLMGGVFLGERSARLITWLSVATLLMAALLVLSVAPGESRLVLLSDLFVTDSFGVFMKVLVLAASAVTLIMSLGFNEREQIARFEYPILVVLATLGMMMMISANDLIALYMGLELQSLALYVVAAFHRDSLRSTEAGLKYFVLGALSSGMLLYGCSLIYGFLGTTNFSDIAAVFAGEADVTPSVGLVVGLVFLMVGLAFKVSAFPFHMWTPDVYEGAPTPVTAFFAAAPKLAAVALLLRVLIGPFQGLAGEWQQVVVALSIGSMLLAAFAAINQTNIKRLMAYSGIGHIGYALVGLAAANEAGVRAVLIYMAIYLVMVIGTFCCILCMRNGGRMVEGIDDLKGLAKTSPGMALVLAIFMFSMAGIPPLAGFFGKLYVFLAALNAGLYALAIIGVLASVVAAFYYVRIVKVMYFDEPVGSFDRPVGREMVAVQTVTGLMILLFFLWPGPLLAAAEAAVRALFAA